MVQKLEGVYTENFRPLMRSTVSFMALVAIGVSQAARMPSSVARCGRIWDRSSRVRSSAGRAA